MKSILLSLAQAHVVVSLVFYFSLFTYSRYTVFINGKREKLYTAYLASFFSLTFLFLIFSGVELFSLVLVAECLYYILLMLFEIFNFKNKELHFSIGISLFLLFLLDKGGVAQYLFAINLKLLAIGNVAIILLFVIFYVWKNQVTNFTKLQFINLLSYVVLIFSKSETGILIMLFTRIIYFVMVFRDLVYIANYSYKIKKDEFEKMNQDFDNEVRKKVKTHMFYLEMSKEKMSEMAKFDDMTGVYNKKAIIENLKDCIQNKDIDMFSIIMFDIDEFKRINDNFGHVAGDKCIKQLANIAKDVFRNNDMVGRYGGDEFIVLLCKSDLKNTVAIAERFRKKVEITTEPKFSISLGVASYPSDGNNAEDIIKHADEGLYLAKKRGRNCVGYLNLNEPEVLKDK